MKRIRALRARFVAALFPGRPPDGSRQRMRTGDGVPIRRMIRFRLLGPLQLHDGDGQEITSVLRRPKLLAVLAYLAAADPPGLHQRDELLALFWPRLDEFRARRSLRKTIYLLRRALGSEAVVSRGTDQVGVNRQVLWCDVPAFREALERRARTEALQLYRGELLPSFHVSGLRSFEEWLTTTRRELKSLASEASWELAARAGEESDPAAAVEWGRRALSCASPFDEESIRHFLEILDESGRRAEALHAYEEFAERLREELGIAPAPETEELVAAVRERHEARAGVRTPGSRLGEPAEPWTPGRDSRPARRRIRARAAFAGLFALAMGLGGWWAMDRKPPGGSGNPTDRAPGLAVLPFAVIGKPEFEDVGEAIAELLRINFERVGDLRIVEVGPYQTGGMSREEALSRRVLSDELLSMPAEPGAALYVTGTVTAVEGLLRVRATLSELGRREPVATATAAAPESDLFALVDELTLELLARCRQTCLRPDALRPGRGR